MRLNALLLCAAVACGGSGSRSASMATPLRDGRYHFVERPSGTSVTLEGDFVVLGDTVMVDATPGPCRYENSNRGTAIMYRCAEATINFDRNDPVARPFYSLTVMARQAKRVCARYTTSASGQQVCAQFNTEYVDVPVVHTGTLRPTRVEYTQTPTGRP